MFENTQRIAGCLGRSEERDPTYRSLLLSSYADQLPAAEPSWSNLKVLQERVAHSNNQVLFPIDGNDQWGDCTIAGAAHLVTLVAGLTGLMIIPDKKTIVDTYFHLTGGADDGLNLSDVLTYWIKTGIAGDKIVASVELDPKNWDMIKQAIQFLGAVYIGFKVPSNAQQQFNAGQPWTGGQLTRGGHCVVVTDYDDVQGGVCLTWGNSQKFIKAWWDECVDEVHAVVSPYTTVFTGETLANLVADSKALGN